MAVQAPIIRTQALIPGLSLQKITNATGNIANNGLLTINLPVGPTYYGIMLRFLSGTTELTQAQIENDVDTVELAVDSIPYWLLQAGELNKLNGYYFDSRGANARAGWLYLDLVESHLRNPGEIDQMAFGTSQMGNLAIKLKLGAAIATLSVAGSVECYALTSPRRRPLDFHKKVLVHTRSFTGTGDSEINDLPKGGGALTFRALHTTSYGAGVIKYSTVKIGDIERFRQVTPGLLNMEQEFMGRNPQTGMVHLEFNPYSELLQGLSMLEQADGKTQEVQMFQVIHNWSTTPGGNYRVIAETIEKASF